MNEAKRRTRRLGEHSIVENQKGDSMVSVEEQKKSKKGGDGKEIFFSFRRGSSRTVPSHADADKL